MLECGNGGRGEAGKVPNGAGGISGNVYRSWLRKGVTLCNQQYNGMKILYRPKLAGGVLQAPLWIIY